MSKEALGGFKPLEVKKLSAEIGWGSFLSRHVVVKKFSQKTPYRTGIFSDVQKTYPFTAKNPLPSAETVPMSG